jgi:hypothetical protein
LELWTFFCADSKTKSVRDYFTYFQEAECVFTRLIEESGWYYPLPGVIGYIAISGAAVFV